MELTDLVEQAIRSDFVQDDLISNFSVVQDDFAPPVPTTEQQPAALSIKCVDSGDLPQCPGAGIKVVDVEVKIEMNLGTDAESAGRTRLLSMLAERVDDRLAAAFRDPPGGDIIHRFVRYGLKLYGIMAEKRKLRSDIDLNKERTITREFICSQIG